MTDLTATNGDGLVDLDAVLAERRAARTPLQVRLFRRVWELPGVAPAAAVIRLYRWDAKGWIDADGNLDIDEIPQPELLEFLVELVPGDVFDQWCKAGLDVEDVEPVITAITLAYGDRLTRAEGEAQAPGRGKGKGRASATSSEPGRSSKPTSRGITTSRTSGKR